SQRRNMKKKFLRTDAKRHSRIGKNRKKLQKWRRATGRHNKIRKKRFGYPSSPTIGYKKPTKESGKVKGLYPVLVENIRTLDKIEKGQGIILSRRTGAKKRMEIIKKANEM